jgi:hypothetical protein
VEKCCGVGCKPRESLPRTLSRFTMETRRSINVVKARITHVVLANRFSRISAAKPEEFSALETTWRSEVNSNLQSRKGAHPQDRVSTRPFWRVPNDTHPLQAATPRAVSLRAKSGVTVSRVRIHFPPPRSFNCRESLGLLSRNKRKRPDFRDICYTNRTRESWLVDLFHAEIRFCFSYT